MNLFSLVMGLSLSLFAPQSAELVFVGDAMQHQRQLDAALTDRGTYDYSSYFTAIEPYISSADYAVVNLETPLAGTPYSGYPNFCAPDSYLTELKSSGFDLILAANNHTLDKRDRGLLRTIDRFNAENLPYTGIYRNKAERDSVSPVIRDINGFKIAFLNYTYGTNGIPVQGDVVVDYINRDRIAADIAEARRKGAEIVAACMHWGVEYVLLPNDDQKKLADFLQQQGVDLIIGSHPHVIQPMEMRRRADGSKVFLVYSLGNFISGMKKTDTQGGAMVRVKLTRDDTGRARVDSASYRLVFVEQPDGTSSKYRLIPAEQTTGARWTEAKNGFVRRARNIFDKHNIDVPLDTVPISRYVR